MKESLERALISSVFVLVGLGIVLFEIFTPESIIILLYFFLVPIPLIAVGIFLFIAGVVGLIAVMLHLKT